MIYIFEDQPVLDLEPITLTRPSFGVRSGPNTFLELIAQYVHEAMTLIVRPDLEDWVKSQYPEHDVNPTEFQDGVWLLGTAYWNNESIQFVKNSPNTIFKVGDRVVAANINKDIANQWAKKGGPLKCDPPELNESPISVDTVQYLWNILDQIPNQINRYKKECLQSQDTIHPTAIMNEFVTLDESQGPIIIGEHVEIKSFTLLEGPLFIGKGSFIKSHSHLKESIIGPSCKIGGEVHGCVIQSHSNKVHDGHLGDSFIGEWVNLGAGTTNSNLKNDYSTVVVSINGKKVNTEKLFLGSMIGDHTKTAIGTQLNTGTVIGPGCNVLAHSFPDKIIASFTFYLNGKKRKMNFNAFVETVLKVKSRRQLSLDEAEIEVLKGIYNKQ